MLELIQENYFFCSIDLMDAYYTVPIHQDFHKISKFQWQNSLFSFICLPFRYSAAPRVFTKLLKPIYTWFRAESFRHSYYIDDSSNMNRDKDVCLRHAQTICSTLQSLGYTIKQGKVGFDSNSKNHFFWFLTGFCPVYGYLAKGKNR